MRRPKWFKVTTSTAIIFILAIMGAGLWVIYDNQQQALASQESARVVQQDALRVQQDTLVALSAQVSSLVDTVNSQAETLSSQREALDTANASIAQLTEVLSRRSPVLKYLACHDPRINAVIFNIAYLALLTPETPDSVKATARKQLAQAVEDLVNSSMPPEQGGCISVPSPEDGDQQSGN